MKTTVLVQGGYYLDLCLHLLAKIRANCSINSLQVQIDKILQILKELSFIVGQKSDVSFGESIVKMKIILVLW